jgi:xanthine/CO dehydrogenase XdhC/CoxF family maturation factor
VTLLSGESEIGGRFFWSTEAGFLRPSVAEMVIDTTQAFEQFYSHTKGTDHAVAELELSRGRYEAFFERLSPPVKLMVYGAGADAVPLARIGHELGWQVTVTDHRPAYLTAERFPEAKELKLEERVLAVDVAADHRTAIVIMTHNFDRDRLILPAALASPAFYIGVLGPKSRSQQLLSETFNDPGIPLPARLYAPIGLDIGGQTPEGIALAIVAEIQSVLRSRNGGHLREREGSIYGRG